MCPLLQLSISLKNLSDYRQKEPVRSVLVLASQNDRLLWQVPMHRFTSVGWQEVLLPDGACYFTNPNLCIITDVDLCNAERLDVITTFLDGCDPETLPQPEWELWLRDVRELTLASVLIKAWVYHKVWMVFFKCPSSDLGEIMNKDVDSKLLKFTFANLCIDDSAESDMEYT
jgi:hypothetical protein